MFDDFSTGQMMGLLVGAAVAHIVFFILSRYVSPLFILAGVIIGLAAFSGAREIEQLGTLVKYIRGYALVLLVGIGLLKVRVGAIGPATMAWLFFATMFVLSGALSTVPHEALAYKGQFGLVVLGGMLMAHSLRDRAELMRGLRFLCIVGGMLGLFLIVYFVSDPSRSLSFGRVRILGTRPNNVAYNLVALMLVGTHLALSERSRFWKTIAYACCGSLIMVLVLSGSRGAMATLAMAVMVQLVPWGGRWLRRLILPAFMLLVAYLMIGLAGEGVDVSRFSSTKNTRSVKWADTWTLIQRSPLIGHGYYPGTQTRSGALTGFNAHNALFQVVVDAGILGGLVLVTAAVIVLLRGLRMRRLLRRQHAVSHLSVLSLSLIVALWLSGLVTSTIVFPSSLCLLLCFMIGLTDRLPALAARERQLTFGRFLARQFFHRPPIPTRPA